uniref:Uncharacterized protein n=1 Tax=Oryza sativa subsp. japonica TaxID=39947 RepID=Q6H7Q2_ORYSJ|nr:hypothetical protein [Oryza sativa Japonica Group]
MLTGERRCGGSRRTPGATSARGGSGGRGGEIRGRGRGRMGWIRMLTGERMRREQEDAGATSAGRMEIGGGRRARRRPGRIGEAEVVACLWGGCGAGPNHNCNVVFTCTRE